MRPGKSTTVVAGLLLVVTACADSPRSIAAPETGSFIVNGEYTGSAYSNVGALLFDWKGDGIDGNDLFCTGSLIAPTVFLTAGHCVITSYTPPGSQFYVSFSPDLFAKSFRYIKATGYVAHPEYGHDQAHWNDLALVFLPKGSTKGITPVKLPTAGILDQLHAKGALGRTLFVNVGYGVSATSTGIPGFPWDGKRNFSKSEFMGLQPTWLGLLMNESATGEGGDCYGDSGGPKFIDGDNSTIYATVTTGDANCRATSWDWRLDIPESRAFLGKYVPLP